jgi:hypothetical protein
MTTLAAVPVASAVAGHYWHWGVISISLTNLLIIVGMVVVFVLALVIPFPHAREDELPPEERS